MDWTTARDDDTTNQGERRHGDDRDACTERKREAMLKQVGQRIAGGALVRSAASKEATAKHLALWHQVAGRTSGCPCETCRGFVNPAQDEPFAAPPAKKKATGTTVLVSDAKADPAQQTEAEAMLASNQPPKLKKDKKLGNSFRDLGCY